MIISEKQIMQLMHIATEYRRELLRHNNKTILTPAGMKYLEDVSSLLQHIYNQQPEELKVIE